MRRIVGLFITLFVITICSVEIFGVYGYANKHIKDNNVIENVEVENYKSNRKLTTGYVIAIGVFSTIISLNIIYIFMSVFCGKKVFDKKIKTLLYLLFNALLIPCLIIVFTTLGNKYLANNKPPVESNSNSNMESNSNTKEESNSNKDLNSNKESKSNKKKDK